MTTSTSGPPGSTAPGAISQVPAGYRPDQADRPAHLGLKLFGVLMVAAVFGSAAIIPYTLTLTGAQIPDSALWWVVIVSVLQNLALIAPLTALGLWLGPKVGVGAPLLRDWLEGRPEARSMLRHRLPLAVGVGLLTGVVLLIGAVAFMPWLPQELGQAAVPAWWQSLLASVSAGITEELLLRLGLMTFLVWLGTRVTPGDTPSTAVMWTANGVTALIFGLGHLPLAATLAPLTTMLVIRTLILNGVAGLSFGWLYWRYGLLAAMVGHMSADVVLHVLSRLVLPA
ncbi:MAG: CPBP family intramembrane glutamic endopeptidase [Chloroflexota bacterium]